MSSNIHGMEYMQQVKMHSERDAKSSLEYVVMMHCVQSLPFGFFVTPAYWWTFELVFFGTQFGLLGRNRDAIIL